MRKRASSILVAMALVATNLFTTASALGSSQNNSVIDTKSIKINVTSAGDVLSAEIITQISLPEYKADNIHSIESTYRNSKTTEPQSITMSDSSVIFEIKNTIIPKGNTKIPNTITITHKIRYNTGGTKTYRNQVNIKDVKDKLNLESKSTVKADILYNQYTETLTLDNIQCETGEVSLESIGIAYKYTKPERNYNKEELNNPIYFSQRRLSSDSLGGVQMKLSMPLNAEKLYYSIYYDTEYGRVFSDVIEQDILELYESNTIN